MTQNINITDMQKVQDHLIDSHPAEFSKTKNTHFNIAIVDTSTTVLHYHRTLECLDLDSIRSSH